MKRGTSDPFPWTLKVQQRCGKIAGILGEFFMMVLLESTWWCVELDGVKALLKDDFKSEVDQIVDQTWPNNSGCSRNGEVTGAWWRYLQSCLVFWGVSYNFTFQVRITLSTFINYKIENQNSHQSSGSNWNHVHHFNHYNSVLVTNKSNNYEKNYEKTLPFQTNRFNIGHVGLSPSM